MALRKWLTEGSLDAGADLTAAARDAAQSITVDATLPLEQTAHVVRQLDGTTERQWHGTTSSGCQRGGGMIAGLARSVKRAVAGADGGLLALPVGLAVEDEFVGGGLEPVDRGLREQGVGHQGEPLDRFAVLVTTVAAERCRSTISS